MRDRLGRGSFASGLLIVALLVVTPLSAVPGFTTLAGLIIALVCIQFILGRRTLWLPQFILRRRISRARLNSAAAWLSRPVLFLDRTASANRLVALTRWPFSGIYYGLCMVLGLMMPLLEIIPVTSSLLGVVIATFGAALVTRDGLFAVWGLGLFVALGAAVSALVAIIL